MAEPTDIELADTTKMIGTLNSVACDHLGKPTVRIWVHDEAGTGNHEMCDLIETDAVAAMGMLQIARDAVLHERRVTVHYTENGGTKWFHMIRMF